MTRTDATEATATQATRSSCGTTITARDFSNRTTDPNRDLWTAGAIRHLVAALRGAPVAIVTDKGTGHTVVNVTLVGTGSTRDGGFPGVLVEYTYGENGQTQRTLHPLFNIGMILELDGITGGVGGAKWRALDTYRDERSAAITQAQAAHPELTRGKWDGQPSRRDSEVSVSYTPHQPSYARDAAPADRRHYETVTVTTTH